MTGHHNFDREFYMAAYPDVAVSGAEPEAHYKEFGRYEGRYPNIDLLVDDSDSVRNSGLFDESFYRATYGVSITEDAIEHYLTTGFRSGCDPYFGFGESTLHPYYASIGKFGAALVTYVNRDLTGLPVCSGPDALSMAGALHTSDFFNAEYYTSQINGFDVNLDPALHYVIVGESMDIDPNPNFDLQYYRRRNSDLVEHRVCLLVHYIYGGHAEGRRTQPFSATEFKKPIVLDPARETVLVSAHQATRTGAPILGYNIIERLKRDYNVIVILMDGGDLLGDFEQICDHVVGPMTRAQWDATECLYLMTDLAERVKIKYAIINSIECRMFIPGLAAANVPIVTLMHEFASYTRPLDTMVEAMDLSSALIFSAEVVKESAEVFHPWLKLRTTSILPQGPSIVPGKQPETNALTKSSPAKKTKPAKGSNAGCIDNLRSKGFEQAVIILGCGSIHIRKGVDLFIAAAAALRRAHPDMPFRFVWVGHGYDPVLDTPYSVYLSEQMSRSGVEDAILILGEVEDLESAYAQADIFFLSSRLDPLPNVAIDASMRGIPIVCFDEASGMPRILQREPLCGTTVVPYADTTAAAEVIARLADDKAERTAIGNATRRLAHQVFNMDTYVASIDELGTLAAAESRRQDLDFAIISKDNGFSETFFLPADSPLKTRAEAIRWFLKQSTNMGQAKGVAINPHYRRPAPGFNPQRYAADAMPAASAANVAVNPFAHYVASGKPAGAWQQPLILPGFGRRTSLSIALQAHMYHPELTADLLGKLSANQSTCDLFISTDTETKAAAIRQAAKSYRQGECTVKVFPNAGRDLGPLLTGFKSELLDYDLIGHVHGKRSPVLGDIGGEIWREFLWQNLIGDVFPMLDVVAEHFEDRPDLGLVFPADPHLSDWDANLQFAKALLKRMDISPAKLTDFFDFPLGTMFWTRPVSLTPLFELDLQWADYPPEPLPYDGSMLHAMERIIPTLNSSAGLSQAVTYIGGLSR